MPVKVLYQKPSGGQGKSAYQPPTYQAPTGNQPPKLTIKWDKPEKSDKNASKDARSLLKTEIKQDQSLKQVKLKPAISSQRPKSAQATKSIEKPADSLANTEQ